MSAGLGWFPHLVSGAPRVVASVTASRLGLMEYAAIPPAGRVNPVDSTDADASPQGVRCCVSCFRRRGCRSERDRDAGPAWPR
jgi:hypothetical protein